MLSLLIIIRRFFRPTATTATAQQTAETVDNYTSIYDLTDDQQTILLTISETSLFTDPSDYSAIMPRSQRIL